MKIPSLTRVLATVATMLTVVAFTACNERKFHVEGTVTDAKDSTLYFENMSLNGPVVVDSVRLGEDGTFTFDGKATDAPEFYRLRIAGQIINVAIDSIETVTVKASYPTMATGYEVSGSDDCAKIRELALLQMQLQGRINAAIAAPGLGVEAVQDSILTLFEQYKQHVKVNYIFKEPMKAYAYFALFQTVAAGGQSALIFNPRNNAEDNKVFAAVATSWDTFYPGNERGTNLHNIAIEGMKDVRIMRNQQADRTIEASKVNTTGIIDIALSDNRGNLQRLSSLKGKVVLLDFHVFASDNSTERIMSLRNVYNKYHSRGLEIYQVSVDPDEHFWKTQTAALPWISVRVDDNTSKVLRDYNVQGIPTFFLLDRNANVYKRDAQIKDLDAEIAALL